MTCQKCFRVSIHTHDSELCDKCYLLQFQQNQKRTDKEIQIQTLVEIAKTKKEQKNNDNIKSI